MKTGRTNKERQKGQDRQLSVLSCLKKLIYEKDFGVVYTFR